MPIGSLVGVPWYMTYTDRQVQALVKVCEDWRQENLPECPESIYQVDTNREALPELAEAIGQALGWWKIPG
jgi:hypothetical protein